MISDNPKVSIIIPVYNVAKYLQFCIDSILAQTYSSYEVLFIDDGSTDESGTICNIISKTDRRFNVIHQKNQGPGVARNTGLKVAKGEFISFIDADDYIEPTMLEVMVSALEKTDSDLVITNFYTVSDSEWKDIEGDGSFTIMNSNQLFEGLFVKSVADLPYIFTWNKLYKKKILDSLYFIDAKSSEDAEFNSRVYLRVTKAVKVNQTLYYYRQRNDSLTGDANYLVKSQWAINNLNVYKNIVLNIPKEHEYWRALGLIRLYKRMLNIRYYNKSTEWKVQVDNLTNSIYHNTYHEFMKSTYIDIKSKILFPCFYYCPYLYNLFMWYCNLKVGSSI